MTAETLVNLEVIEEVGPLVKPTEEQTAAFLAELDLLEAHLAATAQREMSAARLSRDDVVNIQQTCNAFTDTWLKGVARVKVDGVKGHATNVRIRACKWYVGYDEGRIQNEGSKWTSELVRRLRHPHEAKWFPSRFVMERGVERRRKQHRRWRRLQVEAFLRPGVTTWEGRPVARCAVPHLNYGRAHGWRDPLNSGWRDPLFSEQLCIRICGRTFCPGLCAGRTSNHVGSTCARFAVDVAGFILFGRLMATRPLPAGLPRIFNALPRDPVHYSPNGH